MIDINTRVLGIIGHPLSHSFSPLLHNHALQKLGLNYVYLPFDITPEFLENGIKGLKALQVRGVNVTIPYKEKVISLLEELDPLTREIGAVNTIVNDNGFLKGYNTDAIGFKRMIEEDAGFKIYGKKALIVGAGGASRAVGGILCKSGIGELYVLNRTREKAEELVEIWQKRYPDVKITVGILAEDYYKPLMKRIDLLVDTTSVGMAPEVDVLPIISPSALHSNLLIVDLVYNPLETTLLKAGKKAGASTLNGSGMLLYQGAEAFKLWTGVEPDLASWRRLI